MVHTFPLRFTQTEDVPDEPLTITLIPCVEVDGVPMGNSPRELKVMLFLDPAGAALLTGKVMVVADVIE